MSRPESLRLAEEWLRWRGDKPMVRRLRGPDGYPFLGIERDSLAALLDARFDAGLSAAYVEVTMSTSASDAMNRIRALRPEEAQRGEEG